VVGGGVAYFRSVDRYLGMLAAVRSNWQDAEGHFQKALQMDSRMGARTWLAHTQHEYARMLLARNASGDREKAQGLLVPALETAVEVGMRALEERVRSLQDQAPARAAREPDFPDALSQREVEVLRLVAAGKSNRDIAGELSITANTAANHVKNILAKTGAANRTEAAAYAMRHSLV
jgi:DNA-binding NarL/FixJ family response regulator